MGLHTTWLSIRVLSPQIPSLKHLLHSDGQRISSLAREETVCIHLVCIRVGWLPWLGGTAPSGLLIVCRPGPAPTVAPSRDLVLASSPSLLTASPEQRTEICPQCGFHYVNDYHLSLLVSNNFVIWNVNDSIKNVKTLRCSIPQYMGVFLESVASLLLKSKARKPNTSKKKKCSKQTDGKIDEGWQSAVANHPRWVFIKGLVTSPGVKTHQDTEFQWVTN